MMKCLVWGIGNSTNSILQKGLSLQYITGFVETKKTKDIFLNLPVYSVTEISSQIIIVASIFSDDIYDVCLENGIDLNRVVFLTRGTKTEFVNFKGLEDVLGEENYTNYLIQYRKTESSFFERDMKQYTRMNKRDRFRVDYKCLWPVLEDKYSVAGNMGNYFFQDLWAATRIIREGVKEHFDIGSRIDGFIAHLLAANINVKMIDIRRFPTSIDMLETIVDDATELKQFKDESINSLSALCSIEHFGLGRYGDKVDPEACFRCFENIQKKMRKGGKVYISVPIGKERLEFNAHRVFYAQTVVECFDRMSLEEFSCSAEGYIEKDVNIHKYDDDTHDGEYRYGLFYFIKKRDS